MRNIRTIMLLLSFTILMGCSTGSSIVTGKVRPAINKTEVKVYIDPPSKYETIGLVEASVV